MSHSSPRAWRAVFSLSMVSLAVLVAAACTPEEGGLDAGVVSKARELGIERFVASRNTVQHGSVVTLSWVTKAATQCALSPGFGTVPRSGEVEVLPQATTTYTLACEGGGKEASAELTVQVLGAPDGGPVDGGVDDGPWWTLSGEVEVDEAVSDLEELQDGSRIWLIPERRGAILDEDLSCDLHFPGSYDESFGGNEPPCVIPSGARVDSVLLHAYGTVDAPNVASGTVEFEREILAVQWRSETVSNGHGPLGRPGLAYVSDDTPGVGVDPEGSLVLSADRHTLTFTAAAKDIDNLRVITLAHGEAPPLVRSTTLLPLSEAESVASGGLESLEHATLLFEQTLTLEGPLEVDATAPGRYTDESELSPETLPAGTEVASALFHFDPPPGDAGVVRMWVTVTLPSRVLGLILEMEKLVASDALLGLPETTYSDNSNRVLELGSNGEVWLAEDQRSLRILFGVSGDNSAVDELRVLYEP